MGGRRPIIWACLATLIALLAPIARADVDFTSQIKPIFAARCVMCHGGLKQKSQLRLDAGTLALKGGKHGVVITPGKPDDSILIHAISGGTNGAAKMPDEGDPLKPEEIALIRKWIEEGAKTPADEVVPHGPESHWAFKPPVRPAVPGIESINNPPFVRNPIDAFIAAEHTKRGLTAQPQADKPTLIRRVTLDLTGLPPTREELHAFLADESSDAYEKVVDRLLASPRYGERWGRHWMDVWRYSDWAGYAAEVRFSQPHIWRWRDWIIESLNSDKPYDQMVREMIAGDEIAPTDPNVVRATGFLARNWSLYNRTGWLDEAVEHTSKAFLGLTFNCAKCHDHMFDPVSQREYYQYRSIFETYDVRVDAVPGQLDPKVDGLVRVVDGDAARPTYLFIRGDDRNPKKDEAMAPAVPASLGGKYEVAKVDLPAAGYYNGLNETVRKDLRAAADAAITNAEKALAEKEAYLSRVQANYAELGAPPSTQPTTNPFRDPKANPVDSATKLRLAIESVAVKKIELNVARAEREALNAKIAADDAKYATPPNPEADKLALAAGAAERTVALAKAELNVLTAQQALTAAQLKANAADAASVKAVTDAGLKVVATGAAVVTARTALDKRSPEYTPLTKIYPTTSTGRRTALAKWLTSRDNPLPARVAVNHIWMHHMGAPIVPTVFDFGLNGRAPTNQALLDWLAVELMDPSTSSGPPRNWSMKAIHRLILTSSAYRMRSDVTDSDEANRKTDPDNLYLWRANVRRMEAETVRDSVLFVGGSLDFATGGPDLDHELGLTSNRRSLYFRHAPEKQMTFLKVFDAASPTECYRRVESVMPQQALAMANSSVALAQSRKLASNLTQRIGGSADPRRAFVKAAFEQLLSRSPSNQEQTTCEQFLAEQADRLKESGKLKTFADGDAVTVPASADPNQRARENLVLVLLNHNDFVSIR